MTLGLRNLNVGVSTDGSIAVSYNWFTNGPGRGFCSPTGTVESGVVVTYKTQRLVTSCNSGSGQYDGEQDRSVVLASDSQAGIRVIYQFHVGSNVQLQTTWLDGNGRSGPVETIAGSIPDSQEFSAVSDTDYGTHVVYRGTDGNVNYSYKSSSTSSWTSSRNIFKGTAGTPVITEDYSSNYLYALAIQGSSIVMGSKLATGNWSDRSLVFPVTFRNGPSLLGSDFSSASFTNATQILAIWTEPDPVAYYDVMFASIPIQTVWSPYSAPSDPWDGNGVAPYGQYFSNLGEYVSPSTGMLTVRQTDLSVPGRGINLEITRVYSEPYSFLNSQPYNYETYPWAPFGLGWQLNFPWMNNAQTPLYIHLWDGQGYRIPFGFWNGNSATFENHQGEHFRLERSGSQIVLYAKSGLVYSFDRTRLNRLTSLTDATGNNSISFSYDISNRISTIADSASRAFVFCYNSGFNGLLFTVNQTTGSPTQCSDIGQTGIVSLRGVVYHLTAKQVVCTPTCTISYGLDSAKDPAGRTTSYQYNAVSDLNVAPWLLGGIIYPTGYYSNYTYTATPLGTQATSYRVLRQLVATSYNSPLRQFSYSYTSGPGDQVVASTVKSYNGTAGSLPVSYTDYAFSFAGMTENVSDSNHRLVRGIQQRFGVHGEIPRQIVLVTDGQGHVGSYTNYYRYDLWGNLIYSRRVINPSLNWYHESFNAYYNNGLPPGFYAFQETFSQNNYTAEDNPWFTQNGYWLVKAGRYNGTWVSGGAQTSMFSWTDVGKTDISIQANVYLARKVTSEGYALAGIFTHYPGTGNQKWSLVLVNSTSAGPQLWLYDDGSPHQPAQSSCQLSTILGVWYTFNMTVHGTQATGWIAANNRYCSVQTVLPLDSAVSTASGFGLEAGGFSALFANVTVATVSPSITGNGFTNSFSMNGAPGPNIHGAVAGTAELQNGTGTVSIETYASYYFWGALNQAKRLFNPSPAGIRWLTSSEAYDRFGNSKRLTDSVGNVTYYDYSGCCNSAYPTNITSVLQPGSTPVTALYNYNLTTGNILSKTDPVGNITTYTNDNLGRVTSITMPKALGRTTYSYNDAGNYVDIVNENGWHTRRIYDGLARLSKTESFLGTTTYNETYTYNWSDRMTSKTDALGNTYTQQYDAVGRLVRTTKPDNTVVTQGYNDTAPWVRVTDENGNYRCSYYDRLGRLISIVEKAQSNCQPGLTTNYTYDETGNLRKITTANLQSTAYAYDSLNRLIQTTYPDGTQESYLYDNTGNIVSKTDRKNLQTLYSYDSLNRVTTITYCAGTITSDNYFYDKNGNILKLQGKNATINYAYDARNRILAETYSVNTGATNTNLGCTSGSLGGGPAGVSARYSVSYRYNGETLDSITYPNGLLTKYSYDSLGRVLTVAKPGGTSYAQLTYYNCPCSQRIKGIAFGNGLVANYTYDSVTRPTQITLRKSGSNLTSLTYSYNPTGTVASVNGQVNSAVISEQYTYDALLRLTNATLTTGSSTTIMWYQYDNVGNRLSQSLNGLMTYSYNLANDELNQASSSSSQAVYSYDKNGNLLTENVTTSGTVSWTYAWDPVNRLLKVANGAGTQGLYAYDVSGRRVESIEGSATTFYAYWGTETLYESSAGGVIDYVYASGSRIAKVTGGTAYYYHQDALGSTRLVTDSSNSVKIVFSNSYQPFGQDNGSPSGSETYKFTGKPVSATTGLYYYYQRWYDPSIGRFISPDPRHGKLSNPQSLNLYIYVLDRPTGLIDPKGEWGWDPFQAASNWWNGLSSDQRQFIVEAVVAVAVVAVVVATGGAALPVVLAAGVAGGAINVGVTVGSKLATGQQVSLSDVGHSFLQGFIVGAATAGIAGGISALRAGGEAANLAEFSAARGGITYKASQYLLGKGLSRIESAFGTDSEGALSLLKNTVEGGSLTPESNVAGRITIRSLADIGIGNAGPRTPFAVLEPDTGEIVNFYPKPFTQSVLNFLGLDI
jgi:RHS repeat-associated protein